MLTGVELLDQASGYGILVGIGALFAIGIVIVTKLSSKYLNENSQSTEMFMVAGRKVGIGLTASAVFSSWTWSTEFLWVVTMVYSYGVMSSFWYAAGLSVQICIMSIVGIEAKKKIPSSHTCLEIVQIRYGKACHILYIFLCLVNNLLSCSSMILGSAGAISIISGNLNVAASTMLIPFGVLLYTTVGGLKSTFLTDYIHSFILLIILCYVNTAVLVSPVVGGLDSFYDKIVEHDSDRYIVGNYKGSLLTGKSEGSIFFGIIHAVGDFGLTMMDSSFWQKIFSADLKAAVPGYQIAAFTIFSNVLPLGTIIGLANVVLEKNKIFPTYPKPMTTFQINSGFGLPFVLKAVLGNGAVGGILLCIYLSVTSTVSAQMISVSSIISFDIYKRYINYHASNKLLIRISHFGVVFFGLFAAGFSLMLHYVGVDMTWFGYFYSMLICPGVIPLFLTITWRKQSKLAVFISPLIGLVVGLVIWIVTAYKLYGEITIATTGKQLPCMYGSLTALFLPGIVTVVITLIKPDNFDWSKFSEVQIIFDDKSEGSAQAAQDERNIAGDGYDQSSKKGASVENVQARLEGSDDESSDIDRSKTVSHDLADEQVSYNREKKLVLYRKIAYGSAIVVFLVTWVLFPLPLYRDWIWNRSFFKGWVVVSLFWNYITVIAIGLYPLYDGRHSISVIAKGVNRDYIKRRK